MSPKAAIPPWASAVLSALHLRDPQQPRLTDAEWSAALDFCDRSRLTLTLRDRARAHMPAWVEERTSRNATQNAVRLERLLDLYRSLAHFQLVALKGVSQSLLTGIPPDTRVQYDVDLYAPHESVLAARDQLLTSGYESLSELEEFPTDHLPALIRKTGWEWRGDFFDLEIPTAIELHFRLWDPHVERLDAAGVEEFWERRMTREIAGMEMPVLHPADALGYTALHLLRHLLRGNVTPFHVYELATILERHATDDAFWSTWQTFHSEPLRRLESVSFQLAKAWFGCETGQAAQEQIDRLPAATASWFENFAWSPLASQFRPNKDELWLHWSLLRSTADRWRVARQRLLPARLPGPVDAVYLPESEMNWRRRTLKRVRYVTYLLSRARRHAATLPGTAGGALWWMRTLR
jgi:hypothetical protein